MFSHTRCRSRQILGGSKDILPEFPETCRKRFRFVQIFPPTQIMNTFSFGMTSKKSLHVIHTLGANFSKSNEVGRHFCLHFQVVWPDFQVLCEHFHRFCPDFHGFSTSEFGRSAQGTPKLTIKKLRPARYRSTSRSVLLSDESVFTHGFINTTLSTATFIF